MAAADDGTHPREPFDESDPFVEVRNAEQEVIQGDAHAASA
jgi:hypothetical protein